MYLSNFDTDSVVLLSISCNLEGNQVRLIEFITAWDSGIMSFGMDSKIDFACLSFQYLKSLKIKVEITTTLTKVNYNHQFNIFISEKTGKNSKPIECSFKSNIDWNFDFNLTLSLSFFVIDFHWIVLNCFARVSTVITIRRDTDSHEELDFILD